MNLDNSLGSQLAALPLLRRRAGLAVRAIRAAIGISAIGLAACASGAEPSTGWLIQRTEDQTMLVDPEGNVTVPASVTVDGVVPSEVDATEPGMSEATDKLQPPSPTMAVECEWCTCDINGSCVCSNCKFT